MTDNERKLLLLVARILLYSDTTIDIEKMEISKLIGELEGLEKKNTNPKCDDDCPCGRDKYPFCDKKTNECKFWEIYPSGF